MKKQKYEHKKLCIDTNYVDTNLGKMEREGWELISVVNSTNVTNGVVMFWKRPCQLIVRPTPE